MEQAQWKRQNEQGTAQPHFSGSQPSLTGCRGVAADLAVQAIASAANDPNDFFPTWITHGKTPIGQAVQAARLAVDEESR